MILFFSKKQFEKAALKYAFEGQPKQDQLSQMQFEFIDSNGMRYFRYIENDSMPLERMEMLQIILLEMDNRINYEDLDNFTDTALQLLNNEKSKTRLTDISHLLMALKARRQCLYEPDLMFKLCAALYVREDQDPTKWDEEIEKEKVEQFKKDAAGGLHDFFYSRGLAKYLPTFKHLESGLMQQQELENLNIQIASFKKLLATLQES